MVLRVFLLLGGGWVRFPSVLGFERRIRMKGWDYFTWFYYYSNLLSTLVVTRAIE